jgi:hypothetical protein
MLRALRSAFFALVTLTTSALAASDTSYDAQAAVVCGTDVVCAAINHIQVRAVTNGSAAVWVAYDWNGSACGTLTAAQCFVPAGAHSGSFKARVPLVGLPQNLATVAAMQAYPVSSMNLGAIVNLSADALNSAAQYKLIAGTPPYADQYFHIASNTSGFYFDRVGPLPAALPQMQAFWKSLIGGRTTQLDQYLLVVGDSRGIDTSQFVYKWLYTYVAPTNLTHTIKYRTMNWSTNTWNAYTTLQTGTGPSTIFVDNAGQPGANCKYSMGNLAGYIWNANLSYDLVFMYDGVNNGTGLQTDTQFDIWKSAFLYLRTMNGKAQIISTSAGPFLLHPITDYWIEAGELKAARLMGVGIVQALDIFNAIPYATLHDPANGWFTNDGSFIHYGPNGNQLVADIMGVAMREDSAATLSNFDVVDPLNVHRENLLTNPLFYQWNTATNTPTGWATDTAKQDFAVPGFGVYSLKQTSTATISNISQTIPAARVAGKHVTLFGVYNADPAHSNIDSGLAAIANNSCNNGLGGSALNGITGGMAYTLVSADIPANTTDLCVKFYTGTGGAGEIIRWYWAGLFVGDVPSQPDLTLVGNPQVTELYDRFNLSPQGGATLTGTGNNIIASNTGSTGDKASILIPYQEVGATYKVSYTLISGNGYGAWRMWSVYNGTLITQGYLNTNGGTYVATSPTATLSFYDGNGTGFEVDGVSVQKVLPTGTFTLNGATTINVVNALVTANSQIIVTFKTLGGTRGALPIITPSPGTGFSVTGTAGDTSIYNYEIRNP